MDHSWGVLQASRDGLDHPVLPSPGNHGLYMGNHPIAGLKIQVSEILEFTQIKWPLNRENMGKWSFTNGCRMIFMGKLIMDSPDLEVANFQTPKWFGGLTGPHDLVTPHELWLLVVHRKVPCFIIYESQGYPKVSGTFGCFFFWCCSRNFPIPMCSKWFKWPIANRLFESEWPTLLGMMLFSVRRVLEEFAGKSPATK